MDIIFVANNPGSFNALFPVVRMHARKSLSYRFFVSQFGIDRCATEGIRAELLSAELLQQLDNLFESERPKVLVSGSSLSHTFLGTAEQKFRDQANKRRVYSISILDHWTNYRARFSFDGGETLAALPDMICVMDERARAEMLECGFADKRISVTGSPHLENVYLDFLGVKNEEIEQLRTQYMAGHNRLVLFLSEPISSDHGISERGYDELSVLGQLRESLESLNTQQSLCSQLLVKPHPRESDQKFLSLGYRTTIPSAALPLKTLACCDLVVGMTSMLLIEAGLVCLPTLSIQPGSVVHQLPFSIPIVTTNLEARTHLQRVLIYETSEPALSTNRNPFRGATDRIYSAIVRNIS